MALASSHHGSVEALRFCYIYCHYSSENYVKNKMIKQKLNELTVNSMSYTRILGVGMVCESDIDSEIIWFITKI